MAKDLQQFKTTFDSIKRAVDTASAEIKKNANFVAQTSGVLLEGAKVVGLRVQELKNGGMEGTTLQDFQSDPEVRQSIESIKQYLTGMERELQRITELNNNSFKATRTAYTTLVRELAAEVESRKRALSTKLGTGNKSLPELEKLLGEVKRYEETSQFAWFESFTPETIAEHRTAVDNRIKTLIAATRAKVLDSEQEALDEQALNVRVLNGNVGKAQTLSASVLAECQKAQKALASRKQNDLMTAKVSLTRPMKELRDLAEIYVRAQKSDWLRSQLAKSKDRAAIERGMQTIVGLAKAADAEVQKIANARLQDA